MPPLDTTCPLCAHHSARPSWLGSTFYLGREYSYLECVSCKSLYCAAMPDEHTLTQMYGPQYQTSFGADQPGDDPKEPQRVTQWLERLGGGTFIDYGCGAGDLLKEARRRNWRALGVEFDAAVAQAAERHSGARVVTRAEQLPAAPCADVLHLGDVIEHLSGLNAQLQTIVGLIKPGGWLLAQGPLEANANLFTFVVRSARRLRRLAVMPPLRRSGHRRRTEMPPYHVLLATAQGQRCLFRRFGLEEIEFSLHEVAWPAPGRLTVWEVRWARALGLFALRRVSQTVSALAPNRWGNRYFYVGRRRE